MGTHTHTHTHSLVQLDEDSVVDLSETEKLEGLLDLGCNLVHTTNTDDEGVLVLARDVEGAFGLGLAPEPDGFTLDLTVLLGVLLGPLEDVDTLGLASGTVGESGLLPLGLSGGLTLPPLEDGLRDRGKFLVWHSPTFTLATDEKPHVLCVDPM